MRGCCSHLNENIIQQPLDCIRVSVPAFIYMIQNNLIYVAASNLDVATFQVNIILKPDRCFLLNFEKTYLTPPNKIRLAIPL